MRAFCNSLSRKKPESAFDTHLTSLKPSLSFLSIVLYGVAGVVGAGIFSSPGEIIGQYTGPSVAISFLLAAMACAISGVCYADFAAKYPAAGGSYAYVYTSLGEFAAFIAGIGNTFEYAFAGAAVARGWSGYLRNAIPALKYFSFEQSKNDDKRVARYIEPDLFAPILCILVVSVCLLGVKQSSRLSAILTVINVSAIFFIVGVGSFYVSAENYTPFFPTEASGIFRGATSAFFAFIAWDSVCVLSEEVKEPRKTIPRAIFVVIGLVALLYASLVTVLAGMKPASEIGSYTPFSDAFPIGHFARPFLSVVIILCATNSTYASAQGQPRVWLGMARDGLLPKKFQEVNAAGTPVFSLLCTGALMTATSAVFNFSTLGEATTAVVLIVQALVSFGCLVSRLRDRKLSPTRRNAAYVLTGLGSLAVTLAAGFFERSGDKELVVNTSAMFWTVCVVLFSVSAAFGLLAVLATGTPSSIVPVCATLVNLFFVGMVGFVSLLQMLVILAVFSLIYFAYGMRHSKLGRSV